MYSVPTTRNTLIKSCLWERQGRAIAGITCHRLGYGGGVVATEREQQMSNGDCPTGKTRQLEAGWVVLGTFVRRIVRNIHQKKEFEMIRIKNKK